MSDKYHVSWCSSFMNSKVDQSNLLLYKQGKIIYELRCDPKVLKHLSSEF